MAIATFRPAKTDLSALYPVGIPTGHLAEVMPFLRFAPDAGLSDLILGLDLRSGCDSADIHIARLCSIALAATHSKTPDDATMTSGVTA